MQPSKEKIKPINADLHSVNSNTLIILVGGSGDPKEIFEKIAVSLHRKDLSKDILAFSFSYLVKEKRLSLKTQYQDLKDVLNHVIEKYNYKNIELMATSQGAYSVCKILVEKPYQEKINKVHFVDPADYEIKVENDISEDTYTWDGYSKYMPTSKTISDLLMQIPAHIKVNVAFLTLRNYGEGDYIEKEYEKRGIGHANGYPRLNEEMVHQFYDPLPEENKGVSMEVPDLPHAFKRDGDIKKNYERMTDVLYKLFNKR